MQKENKTLKNNPVTLSVSALNRVSSKNLNVIKELIEKSIDEKSTDKINELKEEIIDIITRIYYDIEISILSNSCIPIESSKTLESLKKVLMLCNKLTDKEKELEDMLPDSFIEEYKILLDRTKKAIESVKARMEKIKSNDKSSLLLEVLNKNLVNLEMLKTHYIETLGSKINVIL